MNKPTVFLCMFLVGVSQVFSASDFWESGVVSSVDEQGGLIVCADCSDPEQLIRLSEGKGRLVHCLYLDSDRAADARSRVLRGGSASERIAVRGWNGRELPYVDNLVNLLIVEEGGAEVSASEVLRILAPAGRVIVPGREDGALGAALAQSGMASSKSGDWTVFTKPVPPNIDSWTHYLYDSSNNAVSHDRKVAPVQGMHWVCGPAYARSHEHFGSTSALVSANGRIFYIEDVGPVSSVFLPPEWRLVARDAYSGVLLWERPISHWESQLRGFRSGPPEIGWRLVAEGDRVYVALNYGDPVVSLDAATGEQGRIFEETAGAREIRCAGGVLYVLADDMTTEDHGERRKWFDKLAPGLSKYAFPKEAIDMYGRQRVLAVDPESGKVLWVKRFEDSGEIMPATLAIAEGRACFQTISHVVCLSAKSGKEQWRSERPVATSRFSWATPTLVMSDGVVLSGDRMASDNIGEKPGKGSAWIMDNHHQIPHQPGEVFAFSLEDGSRLWKVPAFENYTIPMDIFVIDRTAWIGDIRSKKYPGFTGGRDLFTGEIVRKLPDNSQLYEVRMGHNRCYRNKATDRYLLLGRDGIEFVDLEKSTGRGDWWVRGTCQYGIMPANGLVYAPKHSCACHVEEKLNGFNVLSADSSFEPEAVSNSVKLENGPAYSAVQNAKFGDGSVDDWSMYRKDAGRSGFQDLAAPGKMTSAWEVRFPSTITPPVCSDGAVYVAETNRHVLHAVSAADGGKLWSFPAEGRIDSPPTVRGDLCFFGTRNGYVYCLRAEDGELAWRFRAAPLDRMIFSYEQLESVWPVHGSVLVDDDLSGGSPVVYFAAGRSSHIDGGIQLYALDARSGKQLYHKKISTMPGESPDSSIASRALPGILSVQKGKLFMRHLCFDGELLPAQTGPHLYAPGGFLDRTWWHRTYWLYGSRMQSAYGGWPRAGNNAPAGRLLVYDSGDLIYGYGRMSYRAGAGHVQPADAAKEYKLFAEVRSPERPAKGKGGKRKKRGYSRQVEWSRDLPFLVRSMVLTRDAILIAGGDGLEEDPARPGRGVFMIASREDGAGQFECELPAPPVLDGMIYTDTGVFLSAVDGSLISLE